MSAEQECAAVAPQSAMTTAPPFEERAILWNRSAGALRKALHDAVKKLKSAPFGVWKVIADGRHAQPDPDEPFDKSKAFWESLSDSQLAAFIEIRDRLNEIQRRIVWLAVYGAWPAFKKLERLWRITATTLEKALSDAFETLKKVGDAYVETATADMLVPDLRFSEAVQLVANVKAAGKKKIVATGVFRYSDRKPCWQAQWEDLLALRDKLVPSERRPMEFEVRVVGKTVGKLLPTKSEQKEVPLQLASPSAGLKPKTVVDEVVTELTGEIDLPAGRQEILLIHRNVVDGKLDNVAVVLLSGSSSKVIPEWW